MYFRNKFNEEFLLLANNIEPKGGSVRLDQKNPLFFEIRQPAFDEVGRYVEVIPLLLYNRIKTKYSETKLDNDIIDKDKIVEDWIALCVENAEDRKYQWSTYFGKVDGMIVAEYMVVILSHKAISQKNTLDITYLQNIDIGLAVVSGLNT